MKTLLDLDLANIMLKAIALTACVLFVPSGFAASIKHVIHISVDGLRSDAVTVLGSQLAKTFYRLRTTGAFTDNARTDNISARTLPNHACQLTGRPVLGANGHGLFINVDMGNTIHESKGAYVNGIFDVVHDAGMSTALFASKAKFAVFDRSWDESNGARDNTGEDNGRDKIDRYVFESNNTVLTGRFVSEMSSKQFNYVLVHLSGPDFAGHKSTWDITLGSDYLQAVRAVDTNLGRIFDLIENTRGLNGETAIILTSDHGGILGDNTHGVFPSNIESVVIPFYAWGPGIVGGANLYGLNPKTAVDPGVSNPSYNFPLQPIRNGDAANLAVSLLGLNTIPASTISTLRNVKIENSQQSSIIGWLTPLLHPN